MKKGRLKKAYKTHITTRVRKGFLLVEVLLSIGILILATATGITLLALGYRAISINAHSLEGSWLAKECANGLRGYRDTNWLRYSYDKVDCWDTITDCTAPQGMVTNDMYRINISRTKT